MATLTFISPKNLFSKIADIFHTREGFAPSGKFQIRTTNPENMPTSRAQENQPNKNKLNISLDDLKLISTALLQYRRNLATMTLSQLSAFSQKSLFTAIYQSLSSRRPTKSDGMDDRLSTHAD